ncbi:MAG: hypothetical protein ACR2GX_03680 [Candidatus Dormibacteria bacterium]
MDTTARPTLTQANHDEDDNVERYLRHRRFASDLTDAVRRAEAVMRLELALDTIDTRRHAA